MTRQRRHLSRFLPTLVALVFCSGQGFLKAQVITEFPLPGGANDIAAGADGNLWFTESLPSRIGRITTAGVVTEFPIPTPGAYARRIAAGPDGNIWFTENWFTDPVGSGSKIGRITPDGIITEFPLPSAAGSAGAITTGPDGGIWFTESSEGGQKIARFTGQPVEFSVPGGNLTNIVTGPDGNLWFTQASTIHGQIGRITMNGVVTEFPLSGFANHISSIAAGRDGNLWFTESANKIGRITTDGIIAEFTIPTPASAPSGIAAAADGSLWFTEANTGKVGRISTAGVITELKIPTLGAKPLAIVAGPDGNIWFADGSSNRIGRITTATCTLDQHSLCLSGGRFRATARYSNPSGGGPASATGLSDSSGFFTFDNPDSVELVVKVLDACSIGSGFWVYAAGLTDQEVLLTVTDTATDEVRTYANPLGTKFVTVADTSAFSTCP